MRRIVISLLVFLASLTWSIPASAQQVQSMQLCQMQVSLRYAGISPDNLIHTSYYQEMDACSYLPDETRVFNYNTGNQFIGYYSGHQTFGNNPTLGRSFYPWYPLGRVNSGMPGGFNEAVTALDYIAASNGIAPPGLSSIPMGNLAGWTHTIQGTFQTVTHPSGMAFRVNGRSGQINIDVPNGMYIHPGVINQTGYTESIHYGSRR